MIYLTLDDLFKYSFVISINNNRYEWYKKVFTYFNLPLSERIGNKIEGQNKVQNCMYNHAQCIKLAKERNYPFVLIFEDDAFPVNANELPNFIDNFNKSGDFKDNFGMIALGKLMNRFKKKVNDYFYDVQYFAGAHAYITNSKCFDRYLDKYNKKILRVADATNRLGIQLSTMETNIFAQYVLEDGITFKIRNILITSKKEKILKINLDKKTIFTKFPILKIDREKIQ